MSSRAYYAERPPPGASVIETNGVLSLFIYGDEYQLYGPNGRVMTTKRPTLADRFIEMIRATAPAVRVV
jgi:hypothetical protein